MKALKALEAEEKEIKTFPYKNRPLPVRGVSVRWLSMAGPVESPEYGLRYFTIAPKGEIPIHKHLYYQTMYILGGQAACRAHDPETDAVVAEQVVGAGHAVFIPSLEPHSMENLSDSQDVTFLCCIANVYEEDDAR
ncbi:MAG: cupin domain-containing protein [Thermodesulfobacteriota bacterium]